MCTSYSACARIIFAQARALETVFISKREQIFEVCREPVVAVCLQNLLSHWYTAQSMYLMFQLQPGSVVQLVRFTSRAVHSLAHDAWWKIHANTDS